MRTMKKLVCALALTVLLIAVMAVDGTMVLPGSPGSQLTAPELECAAAGPFPEIRLKAPHYDKDHNLIGCWGKGTKCVIVVMDVAGQERQLLIAAGGVLLR
ncbi:unnamed protein product [marine sediment metagenome]|uniref:Uncharacterized protein n=1 Tax=marine sediment metagenome TaxID=412755 RepID=X1JGU3_9ZZZZ